MTRVLVTAFEPFGGAAANASERAVAALRETPALTRVDIDLQAMTLPTRFHAAPARLAERIEALRPAIVLAVGQAGNSGGLAVERVAVNLDDARIADNAGCQPIDQPAVPGGPAAYFATLPVKAMVAAIRATGIEAAVSNSAGSFVCNHVFFHLAHLAATRHPAMRCGFVHVPLLPEQAPEGVPSLAAADVARGLAAALAAILSGAAEPAVAEGTLF